MGILDCEEGFQGSKTCCVLLVFWEAVLNKARFIALEHNDGHKRVDSLLCLATVLTWGGYSFSKVCLFMCGHKYKWSFLLSWHQDVC